MYKQKDKIITNNNKGVAMFLTVFLLFLNNLQASPGSVDEDYWDITDDGKEDEEEDED